MVRDKKLIGAFMAIVLLAGLVGYYWIITSSDDANKSVHELEPEPPLMKTITIGIVSDDAAKQIKELQPTADFIGDRLSNNKTRYKGNVLVVKAVENLTSLVEDRKVDILILSPLSSFIVAKNTGAVPFLRGWRDGVAVYYTTFFVNKNSSINTVGAFNGKTMAFPNNYSSSSYLLPKAYLLQKGFNFNLSGGKDSIKYVFSGSDEDTVLWVINGKADIGSLSSLDFDALPESLKDQLKQIERTGDVPRHVISHRKELDPVIVEKIRQLLSNIDKDPGSISIFKSQRTKKYDELSVDEISNISRMVELLDQ